VGQVSFGWSLVPVIGSGWQAIKDSKRGCVQGTVLNTALAASDVFLVRSAYQGLSKGAWKFGSHSWRRTRAWYGTTRDAEFGQHVHHWLVAQGSALGKKFPGVFNQPWNLMKIEPPPGISQQVWHNAIEGKGVLKGEIGALERGWYGTPGWAKNVGANVSLRISRAAAWVNCND
jgi:hypothetical protein